MGAKQVAPNQLIKLQSADEITIDVAKSQLRKGVIEANGQASGEARSRNLFSGC